MNATLLTIMVSAKSKFGVLDATTNKWFNPKDKELLSSFAVGHSYNVGLETVERNGKTFTNIVNIAGDRGPAADVEMPKIVAPVFNNTPVVAATVVKAPYKPFKKQWGGKKSDAPATDWAAKDRSQLIGGLSHDAAAIASAFANRGGSQEEIMAHYTFFLEAMIKVRETVK